MTWPDQSKYEGNFHLGRMHGTGKRTYANGNIHEGQWAQDKPHGAGKLFKASDQSYKEAEWNMGQVDNHW